MVKPMAIRQLRSKGSRLKRFARGAASVALMTAAVSAVQSLRTPSGVANLKALFHWPPGLHVHSGEEIKQDAAKIKSFEQLHGLPPQDSLSLYIAYRKGGAYLPPETKLSGRVISLLKKISPGDSHVLAVTTVLTNLTQDVPANRITPAVVDSLLERKLSSLNPAVFVETDSPSLNDALRKDVLDYYFYCEVADRYSAFSDAEKQRLAGALRRIRQFR